MVFDKDLLTPCPVLKPSNEEFMDPIGYLSRSDNAALGATYGVVKVVPPAGWRPPFSISPSFKFHTRLQRLSDLGLTNRSRKFFRDNLNRFLKMKGKRQSKLYFKVDTSEDRKKTKVYVYDLHSAVEKLGGAEAMSGDKWKQINEKFGVDPGSSEIQDRYNDTLRAYALFLNEKDPSCDLPESDSETEYDSCLVCGKSDRPSQTLLCDNCDNAFHIDCLEPALDKIPGGSWYCDKCLIGTGEYGFEEQTDIMYTLQEFYEICYEFNGMFKEKYNGGKPLTVDIIERKFWEFVDIEKSDLEVKYGADIHKSNPGEISGFPMYSSPNIQKDDPITRYYTEHPFNLTNLPYAKGSLLNYIKTSISGMTIPWIYIGSLLSTFCWHVEDHYTLSANYCHLGATKKWYAIPASDADKFESLMKNSAPDLFKKQPDLLHQLVTLLSPMTIVKNGIKCVYVDQEPNEFVVTYPRAYHAGFNCGFNFNEAVNFTMADWLYTGEKSVNDYKLIKKENVFCHYGLMENIIRSFVDSPNSLQPSDMGLMKRCIVSLENFLNRQQHLLDRLDTSKFEITLTEGEQAPQPARSEDEGLDIDLCDLCKSTLAYSYCKIDNENRDFGTHTRVRVKEEPKDGSDRISINQLITPEASPQSVGVKVSADRHPERVAESESAHKLAIATAQNNSQSPEPLSSQRAQPTSSAESSGSPSDASSDATSDATSSKLSVMETYDNLIREAKRQASSEPEHRPSLRKSRRLQEAPYGSAPAEPSARSVTAKKPPRAGKMSLVQRSAALRQLNEKPELLLCAQCAVSVYGGSSPNVPSHSQLIHTRSPSDLPILLNRAKSIYVDIP